MHNNAKWEGDMKGSNYCLRGYLLASLLGALAGGVFVAILTRALPKMMQGMMSGMMENMCSNMTQMMGENGITPGEMCQRMMTGGKIPDSKAAGVQP